MSIRVVLADDHKILREGLRSLLQNDERFDVLGEADSGRGVIQLAAKHSPDVIIMDITMPDLNGIEATRRVMEEKPGTKVLALSVHTDKRFILRMFEAGAMGYLRKDCASEELLRAIETIVQGGRYLNPRTCGISLEDVDRLNRQRSGRMHIPDGLTSREREVLQLVAEGKTSRDIADQLGISTKSIEKYRQNIMDKLDLHSVADLTRYAIAEGIITIDR